MSRTEMTRKVAEADILPAYGIALTATSMLQTATGLTVNGPVLTNTMYEGVIVHLNVGGGGA